MDDTAGAIHLMKNSQGLYNAHIFDRALTDVGLVAIESLTAVS